MSLLTCYTASSSARIAAAVSSRRTTCSASPNTSTSSSLNHRRRHHHHQSISRTRHFSDNSVTGGSIRLRSIKEGYRNHHGMNTATVSSSSKTSISRNAASFSSSVLVAQPVAVTAGAYSEVVGNGGATATATGGGTDDSDSRRFWEVVLSGLVAVAASVTLVVGLPSSSSSIGGTSTTAGHQHEQQQRRPEEGKHLHPSRRIISQNHVYGTEGDFPLFVARRQVGGGPISGRGDGSGSGSGRGFSDIAYASLMFADQEQQPFGHRDDLHHGSSSTSTKRQQQGDNNNHNGDDISSSSTVSDDGRRRRKNYDISVRAIKGGRVTMEDEYFVSKGGRFAAVFDGHGGGGVSQLLRNKLYEWVVFYLKQKHWEDDEDESMANPTTAATAAATSPTSSSSNMAVVSNMDIDSGISDKVPSISSYVAALRMAFSKAEADVLEKDALKYQGSTAVAVLLHESQDEGGGGGSGSGGTGHQRTLVSANVGDSRAILSRRGRAIDLTRDHKPNEEREKARILAMGETIEWDSFSKVHRVRNLSLSRAIGDRYAKPAVSGQVEIKIFPVAEVDDEFFLLASDGLWDVMSSQDVVNYVHQRFDAELKRVPEMSKEDKENYKLVLRRNMARSVAREAYRRGSGDNICVLMVWLKDFSPSS